MYAPIFFFFLESSKLKAETSCQIFTWNYFLSSCKSKECFRSSFGGPPLMLIPRDMLFWIVTKPLGNTIFSKSFSYRLISQSSLHLSKIVPPLNMNEEVEVWETKDICPQHHWTWRRGRLRSILSWLQWGSTCLWSPGRPRAQGKSWDTQHLGVSPTSTSGSSSQMWGYNRPCLLPSYCGCQMLRHVFICQQFTNQKSIYKCKL